MVDAMELPNQERIRTIEDKENYKYLEMLGADSIKQVEMKEKYQKSVSDEQENNSNLVLLQESQQRDQHQDCSPNKIPGTILEMDKG